LAAEEMLSTDCSDSFRAQAVCWLSVLFGHMTNDAFEIVQCERLVNYFEVH
jgi:hypothetical protein